jgi:hypothetical protein
MDDASTSAAMSAGRHFSPWGTRRSSRKAAGGYVALEVVGVLLILIGGLGLI